MKTLKWIAGAALALTSIAAQAQQLTDQIMYVRPTNPE